MKRLCFPFFVALAVAAHGEVTLAPLFTDHAVLQSGRAVPIWGRAEPGETVSVSFRGQSLLATAGTNGRWMVELKPLAATAEPANLVVTGKNTVTLHDIVIGEVWLASGQSNMEWPVSLVHDADKEMAAANFPLIRQLRIEHAVAVKPIDTALTRGWQSATPTTVGGFTAVGYFFARELHRQLGVPVGIIHSSWGGTEIESWMSDDARNATSLSRSLATRWEQAMKEWPPDRVARYPADMAAWQKADAAAKANNTKNPLPWPKPPASNDSPSLPGGLFNAMIAPLQPGALRGILWYQGESNVGRANEYTELLTTMIQDWRRGWGEKDLPFYFVQLPNFADENPTGTAWARLREAQARALGLSGTGMAVAIDGEESDNLHPRRKTEIARRLSLLALAQAYGKRVEAWGPKFVRAVPEGSTLRLNFQHEAGLALRPNQPSPFQLAGADKIFHPAEAKVEGVTLVVSSAEVRAPVAVRYAWTNAPAATLFNGAGLPAPPFRSDDW